MAAFDPVFTSATYANWINLPPDAVYGPGLAEPTRRDEAGMNAAIVKPWLTGGESRIAYNPPLGYLFIPGGGANAFNPLYSSNLEFVLRQPLLKGAGFGVNRAPIRIAQLRRDQSSLELRQAVIAMVRSTTEAYWDLFAARNAAATIEQLVPVLERIAEIERERMAAERSVAADVARAESQSHAIRQQALQARSTAVQRELRLRNVLGIPPADGFALVPTSSPYEAPLRIDPEASMSIAVENRPDLARQRAAVRTREHELLLARNLSLPQVDASGVYRWNGVGDHLDDALSQAFGANFADWQASVTVSVPLGRRVGGAAVRAATLQLAREKALLQQALHSVRHQISSLGQEVAFAHRLYVEAEGRLRANGVWLEGARIRFENPPPAGDGQDWLLAATNDYLSALRSHADAAADAQAFLARYNGLLARLNEALGTTLFDQGIELAELPGEAVPAAESPPNDSVPQAAPAAPRIVPNG